LQYNYYYYYSYNAQGSNWPSMRVDVEAFTE